MSWVKVSELEESHRVLEKTSSFVKTGKFPEHPPHDDVAINSILLEHGGRCSDK